MDEKSSTLFVDLDYSLVRTDVTVECLIKYIKENPIRILVILYLIIFKGRAFLKERASSAVSLDVTKFPYNQEVLNYIKKERLSGKKIILISASSEKYVNQVSNYLGIFNGSFGSTIDTNLKGTTKLKKIKELEAGAFDYVGDSRSDIPIWNQSQTAICVGSNFAGRYKNNVVIDAGAGYNASCFELLRLIRMHQWSKNTLIFIPLLTSHQFFEFGLFFKTVIGFFSFSMLASSGYLFNDLMDIEADRKHPKKYLRSIPSGSTTIHSAIILGVSLFSFSIILSAMVSLSFLSLCLLYFISTISYSLYFKKLLLVDVFFLAFFYTIRIYLGGAVGDIFISEWLMLFSMFFFLGLAFLKRYIELVENQHKGKDSLSGRGYQPPDAYIISVLGVSSGLVSVLVFCLYLSSEDVKALYPNVRWLWFIAPLLILNLSRFWVLASRQELHHDPVEYTLKDTFSYLLLVITSVLIGLSFVS